jgi:MFS family permease
MATAIGTLGIAGMLAMLIGPVIGDCIMQNGGGDAAIAHVPDRTQLDRLFMLGAALSAAALVVAWTATRGLARPEKRRGIALTALLRRYHPGSMLLIAMITGLAIGMPATFLRTFAAELHIDRIAPFFAVYAVVAIVVRIATRRLSERVGVRPLIVGGLASFIAATLCYLPVHSAWQLAIPATFTGIGHAVLFPAALAGGSATFPHRFRGLGTTLTLGMMDLGAMIGAPLAGGLVHGARLAGLPGYPTMFIVTALVIGLTGVGYVLIGPASVVSTRSDTR